MTSDRASASHVERDGSRPFTILTVCTGNICRSPAAERLLQSALGATVTVHSAGVGAVVGAPIAPGIASQLSDRGVSTRDFAARQITPAMIQSADLVIALTSGHRAAVCELMPAAVRRSFTLVELATIASAGHALTASTITGRLRELVPWAGANRHRAAGYSLDVIDPWRRDEGVYALSFAQILHAVTDLTGQLVV